MFDLRGPDFLKLFFFLAIGGIGLGVVLRLVIQSLGGSSESADDGEPSAEEVAYLSGGGQRAVGTVLAGLVQTKALRYDNTLFFRNVDHLESGSEFTRDVFERIDKDNGASVQEMTKGAKGSLEVLRSTLQRKGLILSGGMQLLYSAIPLLIVSVLAGLAVIKTGVGMSRGKPVAILMFIDIAMIVGFCASLAGLASSIFGPAPIATSKGRRLLSELKEKHAELEHDEGVRHASRDVRMAVALFGVGLLSAGALGGISLVLADSFASSGGGFFSSLGSGSWGGCSSCSSCSSGCGSGCGGGCGGCGGCGS